MEGINENTVIYVIRNRDALLKKNRIQSKALYDDMENADWVIESICLRSRGLMENPVSNQSAKKDLSYILEERRRIEKRLATDLIIRGKYLAKEKEQIEYIWNIYQELPLKEYEVLTRLYCKGQLWKQAETEMGMNHRIFCETRRRAIDYVIANCESRIHIKIDLP